jgi:hypothetical protein
VTIPGETKLAGLVEVGEAIQEWGTVRLAERQPDDVIRFEFVGHQSVLLQHAAKPLHVEHLQEDRA